MTALKLLLDADILIKLAVLDCFDHGIAALGLGLSDVATMRSMTRSAGVENAQIRLQRAGSPKAARRLFVVLKAVPSIDTMSPAEKLLAASIVATGVRLGLAVDGGEALLMAIALSRKLPLVATGDKRAIKSLPALAAELPVVAQLAGLVIPLELVLLKALQLHGLAALHQKLLDGAGCDTAVQHVLQAAGSSQAALESQLTTRIEVLKAGWRQLPWPVDDNYLGRLKAASGLVREAGLPWVLRGHSEDLRDARQEDIGPPSAQVQATSQYAEPGCIGCQGRHQRTQRATHRAR